MLISVIIPIFHGKKYISEIIKMLERNIINADIDLEIEPIFINDSPDEAIYEDELKISKAVTPILLINEENRGIHYSRVRGLNESRGEYILFLDQDDEIEDNYFDSQLKHIGKSDVAVANGVVQYPTYNKLLYRYWFMQWTVKYIWFYAKFDSRIISPGQCLIKRDSIPVVWKERILKANGADDYFLWLMMLTLGQKFAINREKLYTHVYTSANASDDLEKMRESVKELVQNAEGVVKAQSIRIITKRISKACSGGEKTVLVKAMERINRKG